MSWLPGPARQGPLGDGRIAEGFFFDSDFRLRHQLGAFQTKS